MGNLVGRVARSLGIYGTLRALKARVDRMLPRGRQQIERAQIFYRDLVPSRGLVFDIGANIGGRSSIFLALGAQVVAVEPQPGCQAVLRRLVGTNPNFVLVPKALGAKEGQAEMYLADMSGLATLSPEWIEKTQASGRFSDHQWKDTITVPVTTFDELIKKHGLPNFTKVDVEGFEIEVLRGLSQPVPAISLELAAETRDRIIACMDRLETLARYEYNLSEGESLTWTHATWQSSSNIRREILQDLPPLYFGDLYARMWRS